jgi:hypothetical protein
MNIRRINTPKGTRSILTYWYRGRRYRPVLGHNLTLDRERESALEIITAIHANWSEYETKQAPIALTGQPASLTFAEFVPMYLQYLKAKRPKNDGRNQTVLTHHLIPHFGHKELSGICLKMDWLIWKGVALS